MKEPNHKVKRHIVPFSDREKPYWLEYPVHGWLGSGLLDKNGREIFQGDRVCYEGRTDDIHTVTFGDGGFWLDFIPLSEYVGDSLEVIGHVAEGKNHAEI